MGLLVTCLLRQLAPGSWSRSGVSPLWLFSWPLPSRWIMRSLMLLRAMLICDFGVPAGRFIPSPGVWRVGEGEEGTTWKVDDAGTPRPWTDSAWAAVEKSPLLVCLLNLALMVLVTDCLCGDHEAQKGFFFVVVSFSAGSARNAGLMLVGAVKISASPRVQRGRRLIPQNTVARKVLFSSWESRAFLSSRTWSLWSCIAFGKQLWAHAVGQELFPSCSLQLWYLWESVVLCVCAWLQIQNKTCKNLFFLTRHSLCYCWSFS